jgi:hypothetical protein
MENPIDELEAAIEIARKSYVSFRIRIDDMRASIEQYDPAQMTTAEAQTLKTNSLVVSDQTQRIVGQLELHLDAISLALAPMRAAFDRLLGNERDDGEGWKDGPSLG